MDIREETLSRRSILELALAIVAIGAVGLLVTRNDGEEEPRAETKREAAKDGGNGADDQPVNGNAEEASAEPTAKELKASRRVQDRVALTTTAAENTFGVFGLTGEALVRDEGGVVILIVSSASACKALPADEARIRRFLMGAHAWIRKVVIKVEGTGQSLSSYVKANCSVPKLPGGPGKTVYKKKGEGFKTGKTFRIEKRKWAIDYRAEGSRLLMLVFKKKKGKNNDKVLVPGIAQKKRGVGSQKYKEGRGRYYIEIRGLGHWTVRVRDGA